MCEALHVADEDGLLLYMCDDGDYGGDMHIGVTEQRFDW